MRTGYPIVHTSADSVFQIARHEDVVPGAAVRDVPHRPWHSQWSQRAGPRDRAPLRGHGQRPLCPHGYRATSSGAHWLHGAQCPGDHGRFTMGIGKIEDNLLHERLRRKRPRRLATPACVDSPHEGHGAGFYGPGICQPRGLRLRLRSPARRGRLRAGMLEHDGRLNEIVPRPRGRSDSAHGGSRVTPRTPAPTTRANTCRFWPGPRR